MRFVTPVALALALALTSGAVSAPAFAAKKEKKEEKQGMKLNVSPDVIKALQTAQQASEKQDFATAKTVQCSEANADVPISVYHGTFDPMVPESLGVRSVETLKEMGYDPSYQTFPMEHSVCLEEIQDIGRFIRRHLL